MRPILAGPRWPRIVANPQLAAGSPSVGGSAKRRGAEQQHSVGVTVFAALFVYVPPLQSLLGTAALPARDVLLLLPYPFIVWGADELRKWFVRRRGQRGSTTRALNPTHEDPVSRRTLNAGPGR